MPALLCAFLLSLAPVALRLLPAGGWAPAGVSLLGLALLPWIALSGLPRFGAGAVARGPIAVALALPALALAWSMDTRGGAPLWAGLWTLVFGLVLLALLERAADAGARGRRDLHGGAWLVLVPGTALAGALGSGPGWLDFVLAASPLTWSWSRAGAPSEPGFAHAPYAALAVALLLWALAGGARASRSTDRAATGDRAA